MRNMSFALTTGPVLAQTKDVTRRLGWKHLKAGEIVQPVKKCMGLRPGEKIERIGPPVRALLHRREALNTMSMCPEYGYREVRREGFPNLSPAQFVEMFCDTHKACQPGSEITRIEFSYDLLDEWQGMHTAPKDGTWIDLLVRHSDWVYARNEEKHRWQGPCRAQWIDFNGGGWTDLVRPHGRRDCVEAAVMNWLLWGIVVLQGLAILLLFESKKNLAERVRDLEVRLRDLGSDDFLIRGIVKRVLDVLNRQP